MFYPKSAIIIVMYTISVQYVHYVHSEQPPIVRTMYTCDEPLLLECQEGEKINLVRANYGRFSVSVCNPLGFLSYLKMPIFFR